MSILTESIVLSLNANWQPLRWTTPKEAFIAMSGGSYGKTDPAVAVDVTLDENGELVAAHPTKLADWLELPVREKDDRIRIKDREIRCPTIIISPNYRDMPTKTPSLTNRAVLERDGFVDQYTGERLTRHNASVDHVIPKHVWKKMGLKGSPNSFENMVACEKNRNHRKGSNLNGALGLSLLKRPRAPKPVPISFTIHEARRPEHKHFLVHRNAK